MRDIGYIFDKEYPKNRMNYVVGLSVLVGVAGIAAILLAAYLPSKHASSNNSSDFITSAQDHEMGAYIGGSLYRRGSGSSELSTDGIIVLSLLAAFVLGVALYATYRAWNKPAATENSQTFSDNGSNNGRQSRASSTSSVGVPIT